MDDKVKIAAFDGSGFHNWRFRMETVLDTFDLLDCLHREMSEIDEFKLVADDSASVKSEKKKKMVERRAAEKKFEGKWCGCRRLRRGLSFIVDTATVVAADCRVKVSLESDPGGYGRVKYQSKYQNRRADIAVEDKQSSDRVDVAFMASKEKEEEGVKMQWFLDSGATDHMDDRKYFSTMRRLERPVEVVVASGEKLLAKYCGDVVVHSAVGNVRQKCEAKNVLYVPNLSCNLFSVNRVARTGMKVSFIGNKAEITKSGTVMAVAFYDRKQYVLDVLYQCNTQ
ncbi:uncharacterized protein LOC134202974 [Armigeres subalbatus]|uniref:uncharacterized protein LOC134202974 n=1 Tax=Armigeres subalbatus TaxID=124917 RepID=UPI002ED67245